MTARESRLAELRLAFAFLTRLPMGLPAGENGAALAGAMWAVPLVGATVGLAAAGVLSLASDLGLPGHSSAVLAFAAMIWLTRGLHEDGLADVADGFGGGADRPTKLTIMRDSRVGTFGVLALLLILGLKVTALGPLADNAGGLSSAAGALLAGAVWSRALLAPSLLIMRPARDDGLGARAGRPPAAVMIAGLLIGAAICALALQGGGWQTVLAALICGTAGAGAVLVLAWRHIGGYTGDVLGAIQQVAEVSVLLAVVAMMMRGS